VARPYATRRTAVSLVAVSGLALLLSGCFGGSPEPVPSASEPTSETPSPTATASALVPDGTAAQNLPYFSDVVRQVWAGPEQVSGRAYVDALVAAGFDKTAMQLTPDESTVGNPAESIQFSVHWGSDCLVGQVGPATGEPFATVVPALADGACLVGNTRPIDW
jgi:hypothetical protein